MDAHRKMPGLEASQMLWFVFMGFKCCGVHVHSEQSCSSGMAVRLCLDHFWDISLPTMLLGNHSGARVKACIGYF